MQSLYDFRFESSQIFMYYVDCLFLCRVSSQVPPKIRSRFTCSFDLRSLAYRYQFQFPLLLIAFTARILFVGLPIVVPLE